MESTGPRVFFVAADDHISQARILLSPPTGFVKVFSRISVVIRR